MILLEELIKSHEIPQNVLQIRLDVPPGTDPRKSGLALKDYVLRVDKSFKKQEDLAETIRDLDLTLPRIRKEIYEKISAIIRNTPSNYTTEYSPKNKEAPSTTLRKLWDASKDYKKEWWRVWDTNRNEHDNTVERINLILKKSEELQSYITTIDPKKINSQIKNFESQTIGNIKKQLAFYTDILFTEQLLKKHLEDSEVDQNISLSGLEKETTPILTTPPLVVESDYLTEKPSTTPDKESEFSLKPELLMETSQPAVIPSTEFSLSGFDESPPVLEEKIPDFDDSSLPLELRVAPTPDVTGFVLDEDLFSESTEKEELVSVGVSKIEEETTLPKLKDTPNLDGGWYKQLKTTITKYSTQIIASAIIIGTMSILAFGNYADTKIKATKIKSPTAQTQMIKSQYVPKISQIKNNSSSAVYNADKLDIGTCFSCHKKFENIFLTDLKKEATPKKTTDLTPPTNVKIIKGQTMIPYDPNLPLINDVPLVQHRVSSGDTLEGIAFNYLSQMNITPNKINVGRFAYKIAKHNKLKNKNLIFIGQIIEMPLLDDKAPILSDQEQKDTHIVKAGETYWELGKSNPSDVDKLLLLNNKNTLKEQNDAYQTIDYECSKDKKCADMLKVGEKIKLLPDSKTTSIDTILNDEEANDSSDNSLSKEGIMSMMYTMTQLAEGKRVNEQTYQAADRFDDYHKVAFKDGKRVMSHSKAAKKIGVSKSTAQRYAKRAQKIVDDNTPKEDTETKAEYAA